MAAQDTSKLTAVSKTALWTAASRARESDRADRLFDDPFAAILAGPEGFDLLSNYEADQPSPFLPVRTRFFDDLLMRAAQDFGIKQFVCLAAGLDTRAVRLPWPAGVRLFELDYPEVLEWKEVLLERAGAGLRCERHMVGADLAQSWDDALLTTDYDCTAPTFWLLEGLLAYLDGPTVHALLESVSNLASPGNWLGADVVNKTFLTSPWTTPWLARLAKQGAPWRFATDYPETLFEKHGWRADVTQPGEEGANFGRYDYPIPPRTTPNVPRSFLISARKQII